MAKWIAYKLPLKVMYWVLVRSAHQFLIHNKGERATDVSIATIIRRCGEDLDTQRRKREYV